MTIVSACLAGIGRRYDGTFSGMLTKGDGIEVLKPELSNLASTNLMRSHQICYISSYSIARILTSWVVEGCKS